MTRVFCALLVCILSLPVAAQPEQRVLVLGDSILAWNKSRGQSIPQVLDRLDGFSVQSRAVSGASLSNPGLGRAFGFDIRAQLPARGQWDVIIVDGGGNDLSRECGCTRCDAVLRQLVSADGQHGEIPAFLDQLAKRAKRVIWMDYFPVSVQGGPFAPCREELATLEQRMQAAAKRRPWLTFVDAGDVYDPRDGTLYARDLIHPTPKGSARIAGLLAQTLRN